MKNPLAENSEQMRERIIAVSYDLFTKRGFAAVTVEEIALTLGMSKKTLYKYFPSKEKIIEESVLSRIEQVDKKISAVFDSHAGVIQKFEAVITIILSSLVHLFDSSQIVMQKKIPSLWNKIEAYRLGNIDRIQKLITQGKKEGMIRKDIDERIFVLVIYNSVKGIVNPEVLQHESFSASEALLKIFRIIFNGILTETGRKQYSCSVSLSKPKNILPL